MKPYIASILLLVCLTTSSQAAPSNGKSYSQLILGKWSERKIITFFPNGTWAVQRYDGAPLDSDGRRWSIAGNILTRTSPGGTGPETIVTLNGRMLTLKAQDGNVRTYKRYTK